MLCSSEKERQGKPEGNKADADSKYFHNLGLFLHLTVMELLTVALALLLLACSRAGAGARVRLNSVRTVILRDSHAPMVNRSTWESSLDLTLYQCMSDLECREGNFCHAPSKGPAHSRCKTCRRRKRRCLRDAMCCPGNQCSKNVCVSDVQQIQDGWRKRERKDAKKTPSGKGQVGDPCLRSSDCSEHLCCARHFWTRICKPLLQEGQVCTRHRRKGNHGLELFQRCPCRTGLSCQMLQQPQREPSAPAWSSSTLLAVAAKSKSAQSAPSTRHSSPRHSSPRHSSPHSSLLFSSSSPSATVVQTRLHVCRRSRDRI